MVRKYHNHTRQTNIRQREEDPFNTECHRTSVGQLKQIKQLSLSLSLPHQDDCKTNKDAKLCITKAGLNTQPHYSMEGTLNNESTTTEIQNCTGFIWLYLFKAPITTIRRQIWNHWSHRDALEHFCKQSRPRSGSCLISVYSVYFGNMISYNPTLVDLTCMYKCEGKE